MTNDITSGVSVAFEARGLRVPDAVSRLYASSVVERLGRMVLWPEGGGPGNQRHSIEWAESVIDSSPWPLLPNLVPLMVVDERSFACVVASDVDGERLEGEGAVVRWHLDLQSEADQAGLLDIDAYLYADSVARELHWREVGLERMLDEIGPAYEEAYLAPGERPRDFVVRPVRIACQNVIVGLAAFSQDASFDGLSVIAWQTCEVPHVATHEANRALAVLTLCDAFQNGGTMEIRFDKPARVWAKRGDGKREVRYRGHPEDDVPASLRRYARTVGVYLGEEVPKAISPNESRQLFEAITPMPGVLRTRVRDAVNTRGLTPERLCYALLKPIWRDIELDYLLATSPRVASILRGGADWTNRVARQAESEACRAAVMAGMLYRRLNATDAAAADGQARVIEDRRRGVEWTIDSTRGSVTFSGLDPDVPLPWASRGGVPPTETLTVYPRTMVSPATVEAVATAAGGDAVALVVPNGSDMTSVPTDMLWLTCPDRLADIDRAVEDKLLSARVARG